MPFVFADRVKETTTSTGTGNLTLGGAVAGHTTFAATVASDYFPYVIAGGSEWETGYGHLSGGALVRDLIVNSSGGSPVNFSAGTKFVWLGNHGGQMVKIQNFMETQERELFVASFLTADNTTSVMEALVGNSTEYSTTVTSTFPLTTETTAFVSCIVTAVRDNGDCKMWDVKFAAKNVAGTESMVDSATITVLADDAGASSWTVTVGVAADVVEIRVTGDTGHNVSWTARGFYLPGTF